ncbi:MAG: SAM-dependent methyltransferase [Acetobacteraceae bacterium]|nr:SAM-dependent methyltransferase [Acetobacteraceae bacterium]
MQRLDHFMAQANAAYYAAHDPYTDYTTSPEITQVFGEILGLWAAAVWDAMGRPNSILFTEAGPGRGTLMADALRAIAQVMPGFRAAVQVHFIETSPRLRQLQAGQVPHATWHDAIQQLPPGPMILLANEFLDALPIRQFVRRADGWSERYVAGGTFLEQHADPPAGPHAALRHAAEGQIAEVCEPAIAISFDLGARLARQGGAALFIDYGPERGAPGDTLQALRGKRPANPLAEPGTADLTAHVDFQAVAEAARSAGAAVYGPIPQGVFLTRLGLFQRTDQLARTQPLRRAAALIAAAQRLAEPQLMGKLFKALAICHPACATPPGFDPA